MRKNKKQKQSTLPAVETAEEAAQSRRWRSNYRPRIYVASLADCNAGRPHGWWIYATQPAEVLREEIAAMLAESKEPDAKYWAIRGHEGFGDLIIGEHEEMEHIHEAALLTFDSCPVMTALLNHLGGLSHMEQARRYKNDGYRGAFDSMTDFATRFVERRYRSFLKRVPEVLRNNLDYEGIARDMKRSGEVLMIECEGKVHVFDARI